MQNLGQHLNNDFYNTDDVNLINKEYAKRGLEHFEILNILVLMFCVPFYFTQIYVAYIGKLKFSEIILFSRGISNGTYRC